MRRTSGSLRAERFCGFTRRYLNALSFLLSSSVKDTILTTLPKIICVSSDEDEGTELLTKFVAELCKEGLSFAIMADSFLPFEKLYGCLIISTS